jgi:hypothetical protein
MQLSEEAAILIFLGAGASVPLGIPSMSGFVKIFEEKVIVDFENGAKMLSKEAVGKAQLEEKVELENLTWIYKEIKESIKNSEKVIDRVVTFDLESLMAVLEDLSGLQEKRAVSLPTLAFILSQFNKGTLKSATIKEAKEKFGKYAQKMLEALRYTIFDVCMKPVVEGQRIGNYAMFAKYYGPLFSLLGHGAINASWNEWIFTTNWDLCLKAWMDYTPFPFEDGAIQDPQNKLVFNPIKGWSGASGKFHIVPLHGNLDYIIQKRLRAGGDYEEIYKVIGPHVYFEGKPNEIERIFMIYPLEAVGYEYSVRSPYLDMLNILKTRLMNENWVFVIGFSFRDSTIASIFEEVLREKVREKHWHPLSLELEKRAEEAKDCSFKLFIIDSNPLNVLTNLEKQGFVNIQRACIPIEAKFPDVNSPNFEQEFSRVLYTIGCKLVAAKVMDPATLDSVSKQLSKEYQLSLPSTEEV